MMYEGVTFCLYVSFIFFFKQKTAYEMRISDWSSDVCSSDLLASLSNNGTQTGSGTRAAALIAARPRSIGRMAGAQRAKGTGRSVAIQSSSGLQHPIPKLKVDLTQDDFLIGCFDDIFENLKTNLYAKMTIES